ncbi:helix-turn-helix domain-containing protein [Streptomyces sp. NPDC058171]
MKQSSSRQSIGEIAASVDPLLTYSKAGERLGVSAKVVANLTRSGEIPRIVLSPRVHRIATSDLENFIAKRRQVAA